MKKSRWIPIFVAVFLMMFSISAFAFNDIENEEGKEAILYLYNKGIVNGVSKNGFAPQRSMSYAEAVTLYVKVFDLNLNHYMFIKQPVASDSYDNIQDDAWYANAFVMAFYNGIVFPRDLNPNAAISKEEFAHHLYQMLSAKVEFATIKMLHQYEDVDQVDANYRSSINDLISLGIVTLNKENQFQPKKAISRAEAAVMLYNTIEKFGDELKNPILIKPEPIEQLEEVQVLIDKVTDEVNKVTIYWGEKPNPGYGVSIDKIEFSGSIATIYYSLHTPDPDKMYPQVIVTAEASTYVDAKYTIKAVQNIANDLPVDLPKREIPIRTSEQK